MSYSLYIHTNIENGKSYIGITSQTPEKRWGKDGRRYYDSPKFWNAIQKYGWNSFEHKILFDNLTKENARMLEIEYIEKFNTIESGYNISTGGDVPPVFFGEDNHNYKSHFSDETRKKMSENHADFRREKHPRARAVICVETNCIYNTITDASEIIGISRKCINDTCTGRQKSAGGFHWKYMDSVS